MSVLNGIRQIRVTGLLADGSTDGSAVPITDNSIQSLDIATVDVDGNEAILRGGDSINAIVEEEDTFRGVDLTMNIAVVNYELKAAIVGGNGDTDSWEAPIDNTEMPYPFKLEVWVANYTESDSESTQDGFVKYTFNFCKGRLGSQSAADQSFAVEQYVIRARRNDSNPSNILPAVEMEEVNSIS